LSREIEFIVIIEIIKEFLFLVVRERTGPVECHSSGLPIYREIPRGQEWVRILILTKLCFFTKISISRFDFSLSAGERFVN